MYYPGIVYSYYTAYLDDLPSHIHDLHLHHTEQGLWLVQLLEILHLVCVQFDIERSEQVGELFDASSADNGRGYDVLV